MLSVLFDILVPAISLIRVPRSHRMRRIPSMIASRSINHDVCFFILRLTPASAEALPLLALRIQGPAAMHCSLRLGALIAEAR